MNIHIFGIKIRKSYDDVIKQISQFTAQTLKYKLTIKKSPISFKKSCCKLFFITLQLA